MKFVYIHNKNAKSLLGERVKPRPYVENNLKIDYTYYVTNQLMKPLQQLYGLALVEMWTSLEKLVLLRHIQRIFRSWKKNMVMI